MPIINKTITWATGLSDDGTTPAIDWNYVKISTYGGILYDLSYGELGDGAFLSFISNNTGTTRTLATKIYKTLTWEQLGVPEHSFVKAIKYSSYVYINEFCNDGGGIQVGPIELWDSTDTTLKKVILDFDNSNQNNGWYQANSNGAPVDVPINEPSSTQNVFKIWTYGSAQRFEIGPGLFLPGVAQAYVDTLSLDISYIDLGACVFPWQIGS